MQRVIIRTLSFSPLPSVWGPQELGQCHSPSEGQTELEMEAVPASRIPSACYTQAPQHTYISSLSWQTSSFPPPHTPSSFHPQSWTHSFVHSFIQQTFLVPLPCARAYSRCWGQNRTKQSSCSCGTDIPVGETEISNKSINKSSYGGRSLN